MRQRGRNSGILRLVASALAVLGLLGHGLAMLLVSLLAQAPVSPAAAQTEFPAFVEICAADGLIKVVRSDLPGGETGQEAPGKPASGKFHGCPICTAFAQNGPADLPALALLTGRTFRPSAPRPLHQIAAPAPAERLALSRGPPAAA